MLSAVVSSLSVDPRTYAPSSDDSFPVRPRSAATVASVSANLGVRARRSTLCTNAVRTARSLPALLHHEHQLRRRVTQDRSAT